MCWSSLFCLVFDRQTLHLVTRPICQNKPIYLKNTVSANYADRNSFTSDISDLCRSGGNTPASNSNRPLPFASIRNAAARFPFSFISISACGTGVTFPISRSKTSTAGSPAFAKQIYFAVAKTPSGFFWRASFKGFDHRT